MAGAKRKVTTPRKRRRKRTDVVAGPRNAYDDATRAKAIDLAEKQGTPEASRQLGIAQGTIRRWRHETGRISRPPDGVDPESWAEKKREGAAETWTAARSALDRVHTLLEEGDERKAKDAALTMAILIDKSAVLEQASALVDEKQAKLDQAQAEAIVGVILAVLDDFGLPRRDDSIRDVIAHHLRKLSDPNKAAPEEAPTSAAARDALRARLREEWEHELQRVQPIAELPPGEEEVLDAEVVEDNETTIGRFKVSGARKGRDDR